MRFRWRLATDTVGAVAGVLLLTLGSAVAETGADVTFYAPFDGTIEAARALGSPTARVYGDPGYTRGVMGKAVVVGGKRRLVYTGLKNVPAEAGALSFWAKPLDWVPTTDKFVFFVTLTSQQSDRLARVILYKVHNTNSVTVLAQGLAAGKSQQLDAPAASWRTNQWRHFVLTWDGEQITLYVDGEQSARTAASESPPEDWQQLIVGTSYPSWAYVGEEQTAIDELRVFKGALTSEEVLEEFRAAIRQNKELAGEFEEREARQRVRRDENLALAGGYVLASSFMDYSDHYTDNLIDGDSNSIWRPKETEFPQWIELRWRYPLRVDRVAFEEVVPNSVTAASVVVFRDGKPRVVHQIGPKDMPADAYKIIAIPEVTTDRLRLVLDAGDGGFPQLAEFEARGPDQPLVGRNEPYWDATYIWHSEPDKTHKANAPRYFRKTFDIDDLPDLRTAYVQARSNDFYKLYVNGTEVATGSTEIRAIDVKDELREGRNVMAAMADLGTNPGRWGWGELLIELSLNYAGKSRRIGTDTTWRTHTSATAGWLETAFDDTAWRPAAPYVCPPNGPWGRIPYYCTSVRERARIDAVKVSPETAKPGDTVSVSATVTADQRLIGDYFFIFELAERAVDPSHGDFSVARVVAEPVQASPAWKPGVGASVEARLSLPEFAPNGRVPLRITAVEKKTGLSLDLTDASGKSVDEVAGLTVVRYPSTALEQPSVSGSLTFRNGQAAFQVGNETKPPLFWRYCPLNSFERTSDYAGKTGIHLHHFIIYPRIINPERQWDKGFAELDQNIDCMLRVDPRGQVMVLVDLRPSNAWLKANPEERLINGFGAAGPVSYASAKYEADVHAYTRALIAFLKTKPYYGRVIAIKPMTCGVPDSCIGGVEINIWQTDRDKITVGDYNPQAIAAFRDWLRAKYGNDIAALRAAWLNETVTFDTAAPVLKELVKEGAGGGVFRDPTEGRAPFDYFEFLPGLLGRFYQRLAKVIKDETDGKVMVMIHYGYVIAHLTSCNNPGSFLQNNNYDFPELLRDPNIDAYLGAPHYSSRRAGDPYALYFPVDSITLHKRQYIADGDYRTFVAKPVVHGRQRSARETEAVLKKDLASCIIGNSGTWLADMSVGSGRSAVGFFQEESILGTVREMHELFVSALETPRESASEIAVFVSTSTPKYHDAYYASTVYRNLIVYTYWRELHRIGAPFDCYTMSDLDNPLLPKQYKLYVFLNPFFMSDAERRAVDALKRDGKTMLWFYAPGYLDNARGLSPKHISEVTGINVAQRDDKEPTRSTIVDTKRPITAGLAPGHTYEVSPFGYPATDGLHPTGFGPVFQVVDPAAVTLARYPDGGTAFAERDFGAWRSVYMALPYLDAQTLRNIAKLAGVHVYCDERIILDADNRFLMVHNGYGESRTVSLRLPRSRTVTDALSGETLTRNALDFELKISECATRVLRLSD